MSSKPEGKSLTEVAPQFEVDVMLLVAINHDITLQEITRKEKRSLAQLTSDPGAMAYIEVFHKALRRSANNLAIVALVTRLDHWIRILRRRIPEEKEGSLVNCLRLLNKYLGGDGPVPVKFFEELVTIRDSVIHNDSKTEWIYRDTLRRVAECYSNYFGGEVTISEVQVKEATAKAVVQVKWYDESLRARNL
jgi:hypothetical protein